MSAFPAYPNMGRLIRRYPLAASQTFLEGAAVVLDASGDVAECGADPALILGFACHAAGADPETTNVLVAVAKAESTFILQGTSAFVQADEGDAYGLVKDGDGIWVVDRTDTTATRVRVEKTYIDRAQAEVSVLAANRQLG